MPPSDSFVTPRTEARTAARPTVRFMLAHPAHFIALGAGSGLSRLAPGTVGTLWAWLAFLLLQRWLSPAAIGWLLLASLPLGWWACAVTARHMGAADPGNIVWDEVLAFWLVLWLVMPTGLLGQLAAFALFRYFDAAKPGPVGWADRLMSHEHAPNDGRRDDRRDSRRDSPRYWVGAGFGIMFDDLVAAFCTLLVIALWQRWWNG